MNFIPDTGGREMDFKLNPEMQALRDTVRHFAEKEIAPFVDKWDAEH